MKNGANKRVLIAGALAVVFTPMFTSAVARAQVTPAGGAAVTEEMPRIRISDPNRDLYRLAQRQSDVRG